jgi:hypothetical protein
MTAICQASPAATGTAFRTKREARYEARADNNRSRFGDVAGRRTSRHEHIRWRDDHLDHRHVDRLIHSHDDRRYLRRGNDRDVLQHTHRSKQRRLRNGWRCRGDQRWHYHAVTRYPDLWRISAGRRAV